MANSTLLMKPIKLGKKGFGEAHRDSPSICADGHVAHSIRIGCPGGAISTTCATMLA